jgi:hypothetical protein
VWRWPTATVACGEGGIDVAVGEGLEGERGLAGLVDFCVDVHHRVGSRNNMRFSILGEKESCEEFKQRWVILVRSNLDTLSY